MASRGFGPQTVTATPQPAFGTTLSALSNPPSPDMFAGNLSPAARPSQTILTVTDPAIFRVGDKIQVGAASSFLLTAVAPFPDAGQVTAINVGSSQITVSGLTRAHAATEFVVLGIQAASIRIHANASTLYIGEDSSVAADSTSLIDYLLPGEVYSLGDSAVGNVHGTSHYWILGSVPDTFLPSIVTI